MNQLPEAFKKRMEDLLGGEYPAFLDSYEKERSQGLRMNPLKTDGDPSILEREGFHLKKIPWTELKTSCLNLSLGC